MVDKVKQLETQIEELNRIIENKENNIDISSFDSYEDYISVTKEERETIFFLSKKLRKIKTPKMSELSTYGDLMTIEEFKASVDCGGFIDYDGYGVYANNNEESDIHVIPSDIKLGIYRDDFTHVNWFNR